MWKREMNEILHHFVIFIFILLLFDFIVTAIYSIVYFIYDKEKNPMPNMESRMNVCARVIFRWRGLNAFHYYYLQFMPIQQQGLNVSAYIIHITYVLYLFKLNINYSSCSIFCEFLVGIGTTRIRTWVISVYLLFESTPFFLSSSLTHKVIWLISC